MSKFVLIFAVLLVSWTHWQTFDSVWQSIQEQTTWQESLVSKAADGSVPVEVGPGTGYPVVIQAAS